MNEAVLLRAIRAALNTARAPNGALRCRLVRNAVGYDAERRIRYGLGNGSADLVGMILGGRVLALEVKGTGGRVRPEQAAWIAALNRWGGYAAVVRSVDEAMAALKTAETGDRK